MKTVSTFIRELYDLGIRLSLKGEQLLCDAPKNTITPELRDQISSRKLEIITFLKDSHQVKNLSQKPALIPSVRQDKIPLSFTQQLLWFFQQLEPGIAAYNLSTALHLRGELNLVILKKCLQTIVHRHEVLRTVFPSINGVPYQNILSHQDFQLNFIDLTSELHLYSEAEQLEKANNLLNAQAQQYFDLALDYPIRFYVLKLSETHYILHITMHHIISDGWSLDIIWREFEVLYTALIAEKSNPLPELNVQYADFVNWQRAWMQEQVLDQHLDYWQQQLADMPKSLNLPFDYPRSAVRTYQLNNYSFEINSDVAVQLYDFAKENDVTPFLIFLSCFKILLAYYSGQTDIVINNIVSGRNHIEVESLIGLFANIVMLRTNFTTNPTFSEVLKQLQETCLENYAHQDVPLEQLISRLGIKRDPRRPLIEVAFGYHADMIESSLQIPNLKVEPVPKIQKGIIVNDITLNIYINDSGKFIGNFLYDKNLFKSETIVQIFHHFQKLIAAAIKNPHQSIYELLHKSELITSSLVSQSFKNNVIDPYKSSNLTKNQCLFWMVHHLNPNPSFLNNAVFCRIYKSIDHKHFQAAFQTLINSSDALRTVIVENGGVPYQHVKESLTYEVEGIDLSHIKNEHILGDFLRKRSRQIFDLRNGLFDTLLIKLAEDQFIWYLNIHHVISDTESLSIIFQKVSSFYRQAIEGDLPESVEMPQFREYLKYERDYRESSRYIKAESYWKQKIAKSEVISFYGKTADLKRAEVVDLQRTSFLLSPEQCRKLAELANLEQQWSESKNISIFNIILTILIIYLYRISGNTYISVGVPLRNRRLKKFKDTIGLFMQVLPIQIEIDKEETFISLLKKIEAESRLTFRHGQYFFKNPAHQPVYDVVLNYQVSAFLDFDGASIQPESVHWVNGDESFALQVRDFGASGNLSLDFDFHPDVFGEEQQSLAVEHFLQLLNAVIDNCHQPIDSFNLLSPAERHHMMFEWNSSQFSYPKDLCIHHLFEEQVSRTPEAIAIIFNNHQLTYRELDQWANRLANQLIQEEISPDARVGICIERSITMLVSVLGVLKAGGAYVPIDPNYPQDRINFILDDAAITILITQQSLVAEVLSSYSGKLIFLDQEQNILQDQSVIKPVQNITGENLAYIIYTSGSTGWPKGVTIQHNSLVNAYFAWEDAYHLRSETSSHLQMASLAFDVFTGDWVRALCSGAKLVICPKEILLEPRQLYELIRKEAIDCAEFVPAVFRKLVEFLEITDQNLDFMRVLVIGSDLWYTSEFQRFKAFCGSQTRLINSYGVTEATIDSCYFESQQNVLGIPQDSLVPIGHPFANTQLYILNSQLQPVPIGVSGELFIAGEGLARGYLNQPDLTNDRFVYHNLVGSTNVRLYRTGDIVSYLPDGCIEFLGRIDHQVKVRGFRVELGEIESALTHQSEVQEALVLAHQDESGIQRLVAYLVTIGSTQGTNLYHVLKERLPDYMIPSSYVFLDKIPLNSNGKVDRQALPKPDLTQRSVGNEFIEPRNAVEEKLCAIWCELLDLQQVGIYDNFFELGGHSLLATQVISRIRETFLVELPLRSFFELPTVHNLGTLVDLQEISSEQDAIVPITQEQKHSLCLSFAQQRLWILDQLEGERSTYHMSRALKLSGPLDVDALEQALVEIVQRHESLRTTFHMVEGEPVQVIHSISSLRLPVIDLQSVSDPQQSEEVQRLVEVAATEPFDLRQDLLLRTRLLKLAAETHILLVTMHHIASDGWSVGIFTRELSALYRDFSQNQSASLPPLPIQYADFAYWQRQYLQGDILERQLCYWRSQLAGAPNLLELPTDYPRPPIQSFHGQKVKFQLNKKLSQQLQLLSQQTSTTLFITLLSAFSVLLYRYSHTSDIVIGSPIANRNRQEIEPLIGFFVNTLLLRIRLEQKLTFLELLHQVRQTALVAYDHQDLPFEKLVEELNPERDLSYHPLFQVMFVLQNATVDMLDLPGLKLSNLEQKQGVAKFDLTLSMFEASDGLQGTFEYNSDLFKAETIERLVGHFQHLLEGIVVNPGERVHSLPLLTETEQHQVLVEWNNTQKEYPKNKCIHQLFEDQVEQTPDAIAVVFEDQQLTYEELNLRANQLAHYLQSIGVGPEVRVGICIERSIEMVVCVLGILKAGAAYLPLDPKYPIERLRFIISDATLPLVLSQQSLSFLADLLSTDKARWIYVDAVSADIAQAQTTQPTSQVTSQHDAYIIYTSGSTGCPKGVLIRHQGVCNLALAQQSWFNVQTDSTVLQFASFSFDASVWEICMAFCSGASLVLASDDALMPGLNLQRTLEQHAISHITLPPSALTHLNPEELPELNTVIVAGESCPAHLAAKWCYNRQFFNAYGPTESTVCATIAPIQDATSLSIGHPIANIQVYVLGIDEQPTPIGVPGELWIGGDGLARGYHGQPELTAERFISNPFCSDPQAKLYRTGDLVRWLSNGTLEFLGRIDHQIKIRGFRIELGEVEAALIQHPAVNQVVVVTREGQVNDKRLVAYLTCHNSQPSSHQLWEFASNQLPTFMVPSAFIFLDKLPLTPNGKVDRQALPQPDLTQRSVCNEFVEPRNAVEEQLCTIWCELLDLQQVGIYDNFFELGGHSLLAAQLISRIRQAFTLEISLRQVFESPTVIGLSEVVRLADGITPTPSISLIDRQRELPLSFTQRRLWVLDQLEPNSLAYTIPYALRLHGTLNVSALQSSLAEILKRHEVLRTTFRTVEERPIQVITPVGKVPLQFVDLAQVPTSEREAEVRRRVREDFQQPFDLAVGPLIRFCLFQLSPEDAVFTINVHHIVFDGWSYGLLFKELATLYSAYCNGQPSPLQELPIQYADFAGWQHEWLESESFHTQLLYWKEKLANAPQVLELPTDYPRPAVQTHHGASFTQTLSMSLGTALNRLSRDENATLFMTLLTAFKILCFRFTNQERISIGAPIAGRNLPEVESLMGFFVSNLVLHTDLSGNPTCRQLLRRVRQVALEGYAHQDVPFERLLEELKPERDLSRTPLFQVWFNMFNWNKHLLELPGLKIQPLAADETLASKFDLTLYVNELPDGITIRWVYNSDLFAKSSIEYFGNCFQRILETMVAEPEHAINTLPLLDRYPIGVQAHTFSNLDVPPSFLEFPKTQIDQSIGARFEAQVRLYPQHVAIKTDLCEWTYEVLNHHTNQVAHALLAQVAPDIAQGTVCQGAIALLFEQDAAMVATMMAALKVGIPYVPLDPLYPSERLRYILSDAQVKLIVTNERNHHTALQLAAEGVSILNIDRVCASMPMSAINQAVSPDAIAYILYTSGSTGLPKGVIQNHRNVLHTIRAHTNQLLISSSDRLSLVASYSFDAAVVDIFSALLNGATLYPFDVKSKDIRELASWLEDNTISIFHSTPTLYRTFLDYHSAEQSQGSGFPAMRAVVLGGEETLPTDLIRFQHSFSKACSLVNLFGSTESSICLEHVISSTSEKSSCFVSIGYPIDETDILLLNDNHEDSQVYGEIAIRSPHLALGYWQLPELSQSVFLPDPEGGNRRIYRTGDLGRRRADGSIEFLGRKDFQIKLRGFRIEPGEVESVLCLHPAVEKAVVVCREDSPGNPQLIAYLIPYSEEEPRISELRQSAKEFLPDYMIPSAFVLLPEFPLTPSGKINRRALLMPLAKDTHKSPHQSLSKDGLELQLLKLCRKVLHCPKMGVLDNFFDYGGNSLLAVQFCSEIEITLGYNLQVTTLFQHQTMRELAESIRSEQQISASSLVVIRPMGIKQPLFFVNSTQQARLLLPWLDSEIPIYSLNIFGISSLFHGHIEQISLVELANCFLKEMKILQPKGPYQLVGYCQDGPLTLELARQLRQQGEEVSLVCLIDSLFQTFKRMWWHRLQSLIEFGWAYFSERIHRLLFGYDVNMSEPINTEILTEAQRFQLLEKSKLDEIFYQKYLKELRIYQPQTYDEQVLLIISSEFRFLDKSRIQEIFNSSNVDIQFTKGLHSSLFKEPYIKYLANKINDKL